MKQIKLITDGSCIGNPGPGGWACIVQYRGQEEVLSGSLPYTTNNRMEIYAAIEGLKSLKSFCSVEIVTDSQYLKNGMESWVPEWRRKGWQTSRKTPVKNKDLWQLLDKLCKQHDVRWTWVKGHAGHDGNNRVDVLARKMAEEANDRKRNHTAAGIPPVSYQIQHTQESL